MLSFLASTSDKSAGTVFGYCECSRV
jgi:hypothetical protein